MRRADCDDELVTRARRYRLSQADRVRLERHLSACPACRREVQIGSDFDVLSALRPGDDLVVARMASGAVATLARLDGRARYGHPLRRTLAVAAAAMCVLVSVGAGATILWRTRPAGHVALAQSVPSELSSPQVGALALRLMTERSVSGSTLERAAPVVSAPARVRRSSEAPSRSVAIGRVGVTARQLFSIANEERRHQRTDEAIALYMELQRAYSGSEEARLSYLSLGRLLIAEGSWLRGLAQLDEYLARSPHGVLTPEALFEKAKALEVLGRRDEERSAWMRLLNEFGDSVYAPRARRRIEDLL